MMSEHARNRKRGIRDAVDELGGVRGGVHFMQQVLHAFRGFECVIRVDGKELRGKFLLIEVLNIPCIGPAFELAPRANPGDGYLDVVTVREGQRRRLDSHLAANLASEGRVSFKAHRIRQVTFSCSRTEFHFDDECWPKAPKGKSAPAKPVECDFEVEIRVVPGALRTLLPERRQRAKQ
jgi:diacylglycerol kinase family enzyme